MSASGEEVSVHAASSASSSSESESSVEEEVVADHTGATVARSIQVVSAPPRRSDDDDGAGTTRDAAAVSGLSSSSEDEEEEVVENTDGPSRGKSYLQSIRARRPKKKVYLPKEKRTEQAKEDTTVKQPVSTHTTQHESHNGNSTIARQRGIDVRPTYNPAPANSSDSDDDEEGEEGIDWPTTTTGESTQNLTELEMEDGRQSTTRERLFGQFNRYAGSFRVKLSNRDKKTLEELESEESDDDDLTGTFEMMRREDQPDILKKDSDFRRRANKAISAALEPKKDGEEEEEEKEAGICSCFKTKGAKKEKSEKKKPGERKKKPPATQLSPQLQKASSQGVNMMKKVFFPALPHLLQDAWVYLEYGITMFAFTFGASTLDLADGSKAFNIVYLILTIVSVILANIDFFIYFVQMGSCAECLKISYVKLRKRGEEGEKELLEMEDREKEKRGCCRMSPEKKQKFSTYFELIRNITSEAILYPLLICDLFDFIVGGVFRNVNQNDHLNFTLFVIGNLYLVLAVYIMRVFLIIGSIISLSRIPKMPKDSGSQGNNVRLLKWFSIHIFFQVVTHALLIISVALKIRHENPNFGEQDTIFASSFLWINVVLGGLIPIVGIGTFFITNYYYMKEFSISFWIEMMAMLQAPSFTDAVFPSEDGETPADLAEEFVKNSELKKVKKQFERYKSPSWVTKFFFPLQLPLLITIGSLFVLGLFTFIASLILTQNPARPTSREVEVVLFEDIPLTLAFFVCTLLITAFNFKIIILMLVFLVLCVIFLVGMCITVAFLLPIVVFVYIPLGLCVGCVRSCKSGLDEVSVFKNTGVKVDYFNVA